MKRVGIYLGMMLVLSLVLTACFDDGSDPPYDVDDLPDTRSVENGEKIFNDGAQGAPACSSCHTLNGDDTAAAPTLKGYAAIADERVDDESAEEYTLYSIIAPGHYIVEDYSNRMYSSYADKLSKQEVADLVAYLLTLE